MTEAEVAPANRLEKRLLFSIHAPRVRRPRRPMGHSSPVRRVPRNGVGSRASSGAAALLSADPMRVGDWSCSPQRSVLALREELSGGDLVFAGDRSGVRLTEVLRDQAAGRAVARGIARLSGAEGENESRRAQNNKLAHFSSPSWIVSSLFPTRENHSHRNKNVGFVKLRDVASACFPIAPLREASTCIRLVSQGKAAGRRSGARAVVGDRARQDFRARRPSDAWSDSALTKSGTADSV